MSRLAELPQRAPARRLSTPAGAFAFLAGKQEEREPISLRNCDPEQLHAAIAAWTDQGHAITFGRTSDGGAVSVSLLAGGQRKSQYFPEVAALEDFLALVARSVSG